MKQEIAIEVNNLSKKYELSGVLMDANNAPSKELWALNDISFKVAKGEMLGIVGPNGSGKTTLLKILSGITKPTSGNVKMTGRVASILDIGAGFHQELSGRENVFLNGQLLGFSKKEIQAKFEEIVAFSGIGQFINEPVKNYSNGMYLRLAFSILAHLDFDIYLFDEVMSVGDAAFRQSIKKIFTSNKTIILVSHNQDEIINNTSRVLTLKSGRITATEDIKYFTESIDYTKNVFSFEGGIIEVNRKEHERKICFEIETTYTEEHKQNKTWIVHLKDEIGNTILASVGYEEMQNVTFNNANTSTQIFVFNKDIFRSGSYALAFYLAEGRNHLNITRIEKYHFMFTQSEKEKNYSCRYCGPVFYPNTLSNL